LGFYYAMVGELRAFFEILRESKRIICCLCQFDILSLN
jgi:hypothetical protein